MEVLLANLARDQEALEAELRRADDEGGGAGVCYESVVEAVERIQAPVAYAWGIAGHLQGVKNSEALRNAYAAVQPKVVAAFTALGQSRVIFDALSRIFAEEGALTPTQRRVVEASLRDMRLSGVGLDGAEKDEFNEIKLEQAAISTNFSNNVLDATKGFKLVLTDPADVEGLPASALALAAQTTRATAAAAAAAADGSGEKEIAEATASDGPWTMTLDAPSLTAAMKHIRRRDLREKIYRASVTRASSGKLDNSALLERKLALRRRQACLLGLNTWAEVSLSSKMAGSVSAVSAMTESLRDRAHPAAQVELAQLYAFAYGNGFDETDGELRNWDLAFWGERQRERLYDFNEEELRPYFPLDTVLQGLFGVTERLFGVEVEQAAAGEAEVWHRDVRFFNVWPKGGDRDPSAKIASFFLDPYSRPEDKRGGAWMGTCLGRSRVLGTKPVAYLVCNGSPPVKDEGIPSLMTFREVETLFHEFGHGLQHMLTEVEHADAAGINNVEWDAVELPSQFMENWCYDEKTVYGYGLARHYKTGEALPRDVFEKLKASRQYQAGLGMLRQLYFGQLDMKLHHEYTGGEGETAFDVQRRIAERFTVVKPVEEDRFLCSFSHIFAGGYAAGYYSYKWAEVMSADAFAAFEEAGLDDDAAVASTGRRFRETVLALGGSNHPSDVFRKFRGRDPSPDALLRHSGLAGN